MLNVGKKRLLNKLFIFLVNNITDILYTVSSIYYKQSQLYIKVAQNPLSLSEFLTLLDVIYLQIYIHEIRSKRHKWNRIWYWSIFCQIFFITSDWFMSTTGAMLDFWSVKYLDKIIESLTNLTLIWCKKHANIWAKFELLR